MFADVAPAAAVGDVAELGHINMDQRPGMVVLVPADRFTAGPVHVRQPVDPASDQYRVHGRGRDPEPAADLDRSQAVSSSQRHDLFLHRLRGPVGTGPGPA